MPIDSFEQEGEYWNCVVEVCEHGDLYDCIICKNLLSSAKAKSKFQHLLTILGFPISLIVSFISGIAIFVTFLVEGGFVGLLIIGWTISIIYHFLYFIFVYLPQLM